MAETIVSPVLSSLAMLVVCIFSCLYSALT
jgi:hypothetical protein